MQQAITALRATGRGEGRFLGGLVLHLVLTDKFCNEGFLENIFHLRGLMILWCAHSHPTTLNNTKEDVPLQPHFQRTFLCRNVASLTFKSWMDTLRKNIFGWRVATPSQRLPNIYRYHINIKCRCNMSPPLHNHLQIIIITSCKHKILWVWKCKPCSYIISRKGSGPKAIPNY